MLKRLSKLNILSPENRLSQAISKFESRLSGEAKAEFRKLKLHIRQDPPSDRDVYRVTTGLDRKATSQAYGCAYGCYMIPLLQSVQQFAALDDDISGNDQSFTACDLWAVVESCLHYTTQCYGTKEDTARIFMVVGRCAPRYQSLAAYYLDSKGLRRGLEEYFIEIIKLCYDLYEFTSKVIANEGFFDPISTIARSNCEKLNSCAELIRQEIATLNATDRKPLYGDNKLSYDASVAAQKRKIMRQYQNNKNGVLEILSVFDYQASWKHIRKQITTELFLQESVYQDWKEKATSATLICSGDHGVGKSVMLANIVDDLRLADRDSIITYFFCSYDEPKSLEPCSILSSFVQQLLETLPTEVFTRWPLPPFRPQDEHTLLAFLKPFLSKLKPSKVFFVLDGLYECLENDRTTLLLSLWRLQMDLPLLLCVSDVEGNIQYNSGRYINLDLSIDISRMPIIVKPLEMMKSFKRRFFDYGLPLTTEHWPEICEATVKFLQSEPSYLFARLYLLYLCKIKKGIEFPTELPKNISDLLVSLIRYDNYDHGALQDLIELTVTAVEPLTLSQLQEAHSIGSYIAMSDQEPGFWNMRSTLEYYQGLFTVDEERLTVHVARSIVESLSSNSATDNLINMSMAQQRMAKSCLASLTEDSHEMATFIQKNTRSRAQSHQCLPLWQGDSQVYNVHTTDSSTFQAYAAKYWLQHFVHISAEDSVSINLARRLLTQKDQEISHPGQPTQTLVQWAFTNNHNTLFTLAIQSGMQEQANPLLISAARKNDLPALKTLTSLFPFNLNTITHDNKSILYLAAEQGHAEIVSHLVRHGCTRVDTFDKALRSELWYAASSGDTKLVRRLLSTGRTDVNAKDINDMTPLATAVMHRHVEVVKLLLADSAINTRIVDDDFRTPLVTAEKYGFVKEAELLREHETRVYGGYASLERSQ